MNAESERAHRRYFFSSEKPLVVSSVLQFAGTPCKSETTLSNVVRKHAKKETISKEEAKAKCDKKTLLILMHRNEQRGQNPVVFKLHY